MAANVTGSPVGSLTKCTGIALGDLPVCLESFWDDEKIPFIVSSDQKKLADILLYFFRRADIKEPEAIEAIYKHISLDSIVIKSQARLIYSSKETPNLCPLIKKCDSVSPY